MRDKDTDLGFFIAVYIAVVAITLQTISIILKLIN
jgi:hypothetical protein